MAHFHDGHSGAAPIEQFFADAFEYSEWQSGGAGVEIEDTFRGRCDHGRRHCRYSPEGGKPVLACKSAPWGTVQPQMNLRRFRISRRLRCRRRCRMCARKMADETTRTVAKGGTGCGGDGFTRMDERHGRGEGGLRVPAFRDFR